MTIQSDLETAAVAAIDAATAGTLTEAQRETMRQIVKRLSRAMAAPQVPV